MRTTLTVKIVAIFYHPKLRIAPMVPLVILLCSLSLDFSSHGAGYGILMGVGSQGFVTYFFPSEGFGALLVG